VPDDLVRRFDFSRDGVLRSIEGSLERLGVSRVDIVYVHDPDEHLDQAISEAIPALAELRDQGVIGAVGAGMNQWQALLRMVRAADLDAVMLAGRWTLLDRRGAAARRLRRARCRRGRPRPPSTRDCWPGTGPSPAGISTTAVPPPASWPGRGRWPTSAGGTARACRPRAAVSAAVPGGHLGGRRAADGR